MRWIHLVGAIGVSLWSAMAEGSQATDTGALSEALRVHVRDERFQIVTSIRGLPIGVRDSLQTLFGGALDIAEPGAAFQATTVVASPNLPIRRLVAAGCSNDFHCLVYYERGGIDHTWHVALFRWTPASTRFEGGGTVPGGLTTIDAVRGAILAGWTKAASW